MESANQTAACIRCAGCMNIVTEKDYITTDTEEWHRECFRCCICDVQLSSCYVEKAGLLFCELDYWSRANHEEGLEKSPSPTVPSYTVQRCHSRRHVPSRNAAQICRRVGAKLSEVARDLINTALALCLRLTCLSIERACGLLGVRAGEVRQPPRTLHETERDDDSATETNNHKTHTNSATVTNTYTNQAANLNIPLHSDKTFQTNPVQAKPQPTQSTNENTERILEGHTTNQREERIQDGRHTNQKEDRIKDGRHTNESTENIQDGFSNEEKGQGDVDDGSGKRERLFKRKMDSGKGRVIRRRQAPVSPLLSDKEKSSSMSKLLDVVDGESSEMNDLSRTRSFRADPTTAHQVFRPEDLIVGELLGSGFFGEVYLVRHRVTRDVMVLKQLYRLDDEAQNNFLKEVAVLRSLSHPHVLRFIGVVYKDKRLHLITEYVPGGTLYQLLQDKSVPLSWLSRARLSRDVSRGLSYLHRTNLIHRDLNSHNCLVREDKSVIVADFGLARVVQRTSGPAHGTLRRKRYTVVGNPYWMAPEMMNGKLYDEKVDVFSFGIILCEIIARVSADPDEMPRRHDFGVSECLLLRLATTSSSTTVPRPLARAAFLAADIEPQHRPTSEQLEQWLDAMVTALSAPAPNYNKLMRHIDAYETQSVSPATAVTSCQPAGHMCCQPRGGVCTLPADVCCQTNNASDCAVKSEAVTNPQPTETTPETHQTLDIPNRGRALGKCVSASHICQRPSYTVSSNRSHSHNVLPQTPSGYILRTEGNNISITRVDDITEWLDPPPKLKRTSPDSNLNIVQDKTRKLNESLPFLRNQSVEGLESKSKNDVPVPFCRHFSIPDDCDCQKQVDSESSDDDLTESDWYKNISTLRQLDKVENEPKSLISTLVKKSENVFSKKSSYDVVTVPEKAKKVSKSDKKIKTVPEGKVEKIADTNQKSTEKTSFFTKKLLSPKLSRLFKPNSTEVVRNKPQQEDFKSEKSKSKFFIERPPSPSAIRSNYKIRPVENESKSKDHNVIKSDLKLANLGKPMTPIFRRHINNDQHNERYSCRDFNKRPKNHELKSLPPLARSDRINLTPVQEKSKNKIQEKLEICQKLENDQKFENVQKLDSGQKKTQLGISRSNYVSLANLRISKADVVKAGQDKAMDTDTSPLERVI